jgi:hypothetical protein
MRWDGSENLMGRGLRCFHSVQNDAWLEFEDAERNEGQVLARWAHLRSGNHGLSRKSRDNSQSCNNRGAKS